MSTVPSKKRLQLYNVIYVSSTKIRLCFTNLLRCASTTLSPSNYTITGGDNDVTVISVARYKHTYIDLTVSELLPNRAYSVNVKYMEDRQGNPMPFSTAYRTTTKKASSLPDTTAPKLDRIVRYGTLYLDIVFDDYMLADPALIDPANYAISGPTALSATYAAVISDTRVRIKLSDEQVNRESYTLTITGVRDQAGNAIDTGNNSAAFSGAGDKDLDLPLATNAVSYWNFQSNWNDIVGTNHWYEGAGWDDEKEGCYFETVGGINGKYYCGSEAMSIDLCQLNKSALAPAHITVSMWTSGYDDPYGDGPGWGPFTAILFKKGHSYSNPPTNCVYGLYMPTINSVTPEIRWGVNTAGGWDNLSYTMLSTWVGWHHYVGTYNGVSLKLYINGALVASKTHAYGGDILDSADVNYWRYTSHLNNIDMAGVWSRALGTANVATLYNGGSGISSLT